MPTGLKVACAQTKDRQVNKTIALRTLKNRLNALVNEAETNSASVDNMKQVIYKRKDKQDRRNKRKTSVKYDFANLAAYDSDEEFEDYYASY